MSRRREALRFLALAALATVGLAACLIGAEVFEANWLNAVAFGLLCVTIFCLFVVRWGMRGFSSRSWQPLRAPWC